MDIFVASEKNVLSNWHGTIVYHGKLIKFTSTDPNPGGQLISTTITNYGSTECENVTGTYRYANHLASNFIVGQHCDMC
jgi:hypothetical protein